MPNAFVSIYWSSAVLLWRTVYIIYLPTKQQLFCCRDPQIKVDVPKMPSLIYVIGSQSLHLVIQIVSIALYSTELDGMTLLLKIPQTLIREHGVGSNQDNNDQHNQICSIV